jgi:hypothetical protein
VPYTLAIVVVAVAVSYARGGRLGVLADAPIRAPWLLFLGLGAQLGVDLAAGRGYLADAGGAGLTILVLSQVLVVGWLLLHRHLAGVWLVALGLALNAVVIAANGAMPVDPAAVRALGLGELEVPIGKHTLLTEGTRLPWLADIIPVPPLRSIVSVGDIVIAVGLLPLTHALMTWGRDEDDEKGGSGRRRGVRTQAS